MKNLRWLVLLTLAVVITFANSAEAQIVAPQYKDYVDNGCTSVYTGTAGCFSYGADGTSGANGGTAGGMSACTAWRNCVTCARPVGQIKSICVEAKRNAECKCSDTSSGSSVCIGSGSCVYKGPSDAL